MSHISSAVRPHNGSMALPITTKAIRYENRQIPAKMYCDVVFGSPSLDCDGTGICRITGTNSFVQMNLKKDCRITFGQISAAPNGKVSIFFFREFLCIHLYRQHFRKGVLTMKEQCPIPSGMSKALKIKGKRLLPGNYTVIEREGYFRVDVDCA